MIINLINEIISFISNFKNKVIKLLIFNKVIIFLFKKNTFPQCKASKLTLRYSKQYVNNY